MFRFEFPMISWHQSRLVLSALHAHALGRALLRYRNPKRRLAGRHQSAFYERIWREAAERLGATLKPIGSGFAEIQRGAISVKVRENTCPIDDPVPMALAADKSLTYKRLEEAGLPTPRHAEFQYSAIDNALEFLDSTTLPCVVKPTNGTGGGRGVTTNLRTRGQFILAAASAAVYGNELMIEEQIQGDNYRLLYLNGECIDSFQRRPPTVIGDGKSTVSRLIRLANEDRLQSGSEISQVLLDVNLDMKRTLAGQGLTLNSVPGQGVEVVVKNVVNENRGSDNISANHRLCPSIIEAGARAARVVGLRFAGVDIITRDPSVPLWESRGVILEVNSPPNYYFHYHKRDESFHVAVHVLRWLLDKSSESIEVHHSTHNGKDVSFS